MQKWGEGFQKKLAVITSNYSKTERSSKKAFAPTKTNANLIVNAMKLKFRIH